MELVDVGAGLTHDECAAQCALFTKDKTLAFVDHPYELLLTKTTNAPMLKSDDGVTIWNMQRYAEAEYDGCNTLWTSSASLGYDPMYNPSDTCVSLNKTKGLHWAAHRGHAWIVMPADEAIEFRRQYP